MTTLLELIWTVSEITPDDEEVVATVAHMIESGVVQVGRGAARGGRGRDRGGAASARSAVPTANLLGILGGRAIG